MADYVNLMALGADGNCPEQLRPLPNEDGIAVYDFETGCVNWVPLSSIGGGNTSVVTVNPDGTYTHSDGATPAVETIIDTRASSNLFDPANSDLDEDDVQAAIDEFANIHDGWRLAGVGGAGPAAANPTRGGDDLNVADDIQHIGDTLIGGAVGDVMDPVTTTAKLQVQGGSLVISSDDPVSAVTINPMSIANEQRYRILNRVTTATDSGYFRIVPSDDANASLAFGWFIDRRGNAGIENGLQPWAIKGLTQNCYADRDATLGAVSTVTPPAAPWQPNYTHRWTKVNAGISEYWVMNGAGTSTQLSAHPAAAFDLMPAPAWYDNPSYNWSYNVFTRVLTGALLMGSPNGRYLSGDIDSGDYEIRDDTGAVLSSGTDPRLAYGQVHAQDDDFVNAGSGSERWDFWNSRIATATAASQAEWDAKADETSPEEAEAELGPRPEDYVDVLPPAALMASQNWLETVIVDSYPGSDGQSGAWQVSNGGYTVDYNATAPSASAGSGITVSTGSIEVMIPATGINMWSIDIFDLDNVNVETVQFDVAPEAFTNAVQVDPFTFTGSGDNLLSQFTFSGTTTVVNIVRTDAGAGEFLLEQVTLN